jgi:hypothetical protein
MLRITPITHPFHQDRYEALIQKTGRSYEVWSAVKLRAKTTFACPTNKHLCCLICSKNNWDCQLDQLGDLGLSGFELSS